MGAVRRKRRDGKAPGSTNRDVSDNDSKDIVRRWNLEIEAELRREAVRQESHARWRAVTWTVLWFLWLAVLVLVMVQLKALH